MKRNNKSETEYTPRQLAWVIISVILLLASLALFFVDSTAARPLMSHLPFNLLRLTVISGAIICTIYATQRYWQIAAAKQAKDLPKDRLLGRLSIILPSIAIAFGLIQLLFPEFATLLVRKESWPFFRNAIFVKCAFEIIGLIMFARIAAHYLKKRQWLPGVVAILVALVLFVMAGEELSWGQRIFGWDTPDSISAGNAQNETNLHNFATQAFQNTLYFGGWTLLIALPFLRDLFAKWLNKVKSLRFLIDWLPPFQFVLIFALGFAFSDPLIASHGTPETGVYFSSNLFIVVGALATLVAQLIWRCHQHLPIRQLWGLIVTFVAIATLNLLHNGVWEYNAGAATEYLELFITFGFMLWSICIWRRIR